MKLPNILGKSKLETRKFGYQPRFYDEQKEDRELREKEKAREKDNSVEGAKRRISQSFQQSKDLAKHRKAVSRKTNTRVISIVFVLLVVFYFLIKEFLPLLLKTLSI